MSDIEHDAGGWRLKGWHVLAMFLAFFGTIISVNLFMAYQAVSTFPGLEAKNGFVSSQSFEARRDAQDALGWRVGATLEDGVLAVAFTDDAGRPVEVAGLDAIVGKATHVNEDRIPEFTYRQGVFLTPMALGAGNWNIRLMAVAPDGTSFQARVPLRVR